jgi:hypothetical protein
MSAGFSAFELTAGWEDDFWVGSSPGIGSNPASLGWEILRGEGDWVLRDGLLWHTNPGNLQAQIVKGPPLEEYELVANLRSDDHAGRDGSYGIFPALDPSGGIDPPIALEYLGSSEIRNSWGLAAHTSAGSRIFPLPEGFDPAVFQQFRFIKRSRRLILQWESQVLGEMNISAGSTRVGLYAHRAKVAVDLVRVTAIPPASEIREGSAEHS